MFFYSEILIIFSKFLMFVQNFNVYLIVLVPIILNSAF